MARTLPALVVGALAFLVASAAAPADAQGPAPTFVALPYVQPGDGPTLTGSDVKVLCWLTDQVPAEFVVEFAIGDGPVQTAKPTRTKLDFPALKAPPPRVLEVAPPPREVTGPPKAELTTEPKEPKVPLPPEKDQHYFAYAAFLTELPFNSSVTYRVKLGDKLIREATFRTRATADRSVRFVMVGDLAQGRPAQKEVAFRIAAEKPEFLVALGDIVYPSGRANQYAAYYWGTYNNVSETSPKTGAPLMATVPFYPVLGNHDIAAKFPTVPDALSVYRFFHVPKNGPGIGPWTTPVGKTAFDSVVVGPFQAETGGNYPAIDAYSFDYGPVHIAVFNNNVKGQAIDAPEFRKWLAADLKATSARWKLVCYHVPAFQASRQHYAEQQCRQLQPLFEECGVDLAFAGHVHNYQRSLPIRFAPDKAGLVKGKVNGSFTLDTTFDGVKQTTPKGVIHVVAGGGGASLYGPAFEKVVDDLKKVHGDNFAPYTARHVADRHSFVVLDVTPDRLDFRALGADGGELDRMLLTKPKP
jgi:predicted phosphodiesterase